MHRPIVCRKKTKLTIFLLMASLAHLAACASESEPAPIRTALEGVEEPSTMGFALDDLHLLEQPLTSELVWLPGENGFEVEPDSGRTVLYLDFRTTSDAIYEVDPCPEGRPAGFSNVPRMCDRYLETTLGLDAWTQDGSLEAESLCELKVYSQSEWNLNCSIQPDALGGDYRVLNHPEGELSARAIMEPAEQSIQGSLGFTVKSSPEPDGAGGATGSATGFVAARWK